jgi:hypothetical protein
VLLITRRDTDRNGAFTYGGTKGSGVLARLADEGVEVRWTDSLHSKIYLNEDEVFVTSMNLLSSSAANSKEIGLSLIQGANVAAVREYVWQLRALSKAFESDSSSKVKTAAKPSPSKPVRYSKKVSQRPRAKRSEPKKRGGGFGGFLKDLILSAPGYCVRCGEGLTEAEVDSGKVMCAKDYGSWAKFKNPEFKENFCTTCGDEKTTSFGRPQCRECYADNPR